MGRAVPAVGRALDILALFLDEERLSAPEVAGRRSTAPIPCGWCLRWGGAVVAGLSISVPRRAALA